jgi:hypothetical protein
LLWIKRTFRLIFPACIKRTPIQFCCILSQGFNSRQRIEKWTRDWLLKGRTKTSNHLNMAMDFLVTFTGKHSRSTQPFRPRKFALMMSNILNSTQQGIHLLLREGKSITLIIN